MDSDKRFSISFSSWDYELSKSVLLLLDLVEEARCAIPITNVLYHYLTTRFGEGWCVVSSIESYDALKYSHGYCFIVSDSETSEDIFCFKPDIAVGNISKQCLEDKVELPDLCEVSVIHSSMNKAMQREVLELLHSVLHTTMDLEDQSIVMRTLLTESFSVLYHVVCSQTSIVYQFDNSICRNVLYFKHDDVFILLWQTVMKKKYLREVRRTRWYEGNLPFLLLLFLSSYFVLMLFSNYAFHERMHTSSSPLVMKTNEKYFTLFVMSLVSMMIIFQCRNNSRRRRFREDIKVGEELVLRYAKR